LTLFKFFVRVDEGEKLAQHLLVHFSTYTHTAPQHQLTLLRSLNFANTAISWEEHKVKVGYQANPGRLSLLLASNEFWIFNSIVSPNEQQYALVSGHAHAPHTTVEHHQRRRIFIVFFFLRSKPMSRRSSESSWKATNRAESVRPSNLRFLVEKEKRVGRSTSRILQIVPSTGTVCVEPQIVWICEVWGGVEDTRMVCAHDCALSDVRIFPCFRKFLTARSPPFPVSSAPSHRCSKINAITVPVAECSFFWPGTHAQAIPLKKGLKNVTQKALTTTHTLLYPPPRPWHCAQVWRCVWWSTLFGSHFWGLFW